MDITIYLEELLIQYEPYAILIIALFGLVHPLTENPWSLFTLTVAITFLGIPLAYTTILLSNLLGVLILYWLAHIIRTDNSRTTDTIINKALGWLEKTPMYKHIIVIGLPTVPTYPVKIAMPFTNMSFPRYLVTLMGSYLFLTIANSHLYFGVLGIFADWIPSWLAIVMLILFALLLYAGKDIRQYWNKSKQNEL